MSIEADHASVSSVVGEIRFSTNILNWPQRFFFFKFCPKIACQAPKPPKPHKQKEIELAG
jgi:hypothetical protein